MAESFATPSLSLCLSPFQIETPHENLPSFMFPDGIYKEHNPYGEDVYTLGVFRLYSDMYSKNCSRDDFTGDMFFWTSEENRNQFKDPKTGVFSCLFYSNRHNGSTMPSIEEINTWLASDPNPNLTKNQDSFDFDDPNYYEDDE